MKKKKHVFVSRCKVWRLKEMDVLREFQERVWTNFGLSERARGSVECLWKELKKCMVEGADAACGRTKGPPIHKQSWWWNDEVVRVVKEKRRLFAMKEKSKGGDDKIKATFDDQAFHEASQ